MKSYSKNRKMRTFLWELVSNIILRLSMNSYSENQKMRTFLPELVSDILLRLPAKSLLRFRCLSTSLCSEIDSPDFIQNHLNKSIQNQIHQKLIVNSRNGTHFYTLDFDGGLKEATVLNCPFKHPCATPLLVGGSCNGLILLVLGESRLNLWNPFTGRYKNIPSCPVETLPTYIRIYLLGLGHDSAVDDYKIVMVPFFEDCDRIHFSFPTWVFSLKRNSWRRSQDAPVELRDILSMKASFANGALYWQCSGDDRKIVGFDLTNEVFFKIPLFVNSRVLINRINTRQLYFYYDTMAVLGGKLFTTKIIAESKTVEFYLHVSDKGGEEARGSWKKAFEMEDEEIEWFLTGKGKGNRLFLPWPLAYSKDGDSILVYKKNEVFWYNPETKSRQRVFWYNPETKSRQRVEILGITPAQSECYSFHVCWESLVSPGNESVFDAAPKNSRIETLRKIAAANITGKNLALCLACVIFLFYFDFWVNLSLLFFNLVFALLFHFLVVHAMRR